MGFVPAAAGTTTYFWLFCLHHGCACDSVTVVPPKLILPDTSRPARTRGTRRRNTPEGVSVDDRSVPALLSSTQFKLVAPNRQQHREHVGFQAYQSVPEAGAFARCTHPVDPSQNRELHSSRCCVSTSIVLAHSRIHPVHRDAPRTHAGIGKPRKMCLLAETASIPCLLPSRVLPTTLPGSASSMSLRGQTTRTTALPTIRLGQRTCAFESDRRAIVQGAPPPRVLRLPVPPAPDKGGQ